MSQSLSESQIQALMGLSANDDSDALWQGLETLLPHLDQQAVASLQIPCDSSLGLFCFSAGDCDLFLSVDGGGQVHFGQVNPLILRQSIPLADFAPARDILGSVVVTRRLRIAGSTLDALIMLRQGKHGQTSVYHAEIVLEREWLLRPVHYQTNAADGWQPVAATAMPQWLVQWTIHRDADPPFHEPPVWLQKVNPAKHAIVLCSASHTCVTDGNNICAQSSEGRSWRFSPSTGSTMMAMRSTQEGPRLISLGQNSAFRLDLVERSEPAVSLLVQGPIAHIAFTGKAEEASQYLVLFTDGRLLHLRHAEDRRLLHLWQKIWHQLALSKDEFDRYLRQALVQPHAPRSLIVKRRALERYARVPSDALSYALDPLLDLAVWLNRERRAVWKSLLDARAHLSQPQIWSVGSYTCAYLESNSVFEQVQETTYTHDQPPLPHLIDDGPIAPPTHLKHNAVQRVHTSNRIRDYFWRKVQRDDLLMPEELERPGLRALVIATIIAGRGHLIDANKLAEEAPHGLAQRIKESLSRFHTDLLAMAQHKEKAVDSRDQVALVPLGVVNLKLGEHYGQFFSTVSDRVGLPSKVSGGQISLLSAAAVFSTLFASLPSAWSALAGLGSLAFAFMKMRSNWVGMPPLLLVISSEDSLGWSFCSRWIRALSERQIAHLEDPYTTELIASGAVPPLGSFLFNLMDTVIQKRYEVLLVQADAWSQRSGDLAYLLGVSRRILYVKSLGSADWTHPWGTQLEPYQVKLEQIVWDVTARDDFESERLSSLLYL